MFFKIFFASLLAIMVAGLLLVVLLVGIGTSFSKTEKPEIKPNTVLFLDLSQPIAEQTREDQMAFGSFKLENMPGLRDMVVALDRACADSSVKALYILARGSGLGTAASQELGLAIEKFKASGKPVVAFADIMPQNAYWIAHRANKVFVQPGGAFEWVGLHTELLFFKGLLDKMEVTPEIFYAGQFKSATEPFRMKKMSDANRLQLKAFLQSMQSSLFGSVSKHRKISIDRLNLLANNLSVRTSEQAATEGLIDAAIYDDQVRDSLRKMVRLGKNAEIPFMTLANYSKATKSNGSGDKIAVIYAEGEIIDGNGDDATIGSAKFRSFLSKIRTDDKIKAVVLRINSPGGSAIASENIWRELKLIEKQKPLVVSMGDYAASGGYYIATAADSIFAMPGTLTGSIGVFTLSFNAQKLFNNKLGLDFDGVSTHAYSDNGSITREMTAFEKQVAQSDVDSIYALFKKRVMEGRKLANARVDSIAQGRIWSGSEALNNGLADAKGGLKDAIACAARMAKVKNYAIREYPQRKGFLEQLFGEPEDPNTVQMRLFAKQLTPQHAAIVKEYKNLMQFNNLPQTRLPFVLQTP